MESFIPRETESKETFNSIQNPEYSKPEADEASFEIKAYFI